MIKVDINLTPDSCDIYKYWHEYTQTLTQSAVFDITNVDEFNVIKSFNETKRNTHRQSVKKGYHSRQISWDERTKYLQDIHDINTSKSVRQNKPMSDSYSVYPKAESNRQDCRNHFATFLGCFGSDRKMYAYIATNVCGEMCAASQIIGHGEYLNDGIMVNIWAQFVKVCKQSGIKYIVYSRWKDGVDGLKSWKTAVGMKPMIIYES